MGIAEAVSAPEVEWSLVDAGFTVVAFSRRGRVAALRRQIWRFVILDRAECPSECSKIGPIHQSFSSWRAITRRWISLVPSPMVQSFTSR